MNIIELREASVVLGDARILHSLSLTIAEGDHTAILGPNGAGKSTLIKLLALEQYPAAAERDAVVAGEGVVEREAPAERPPVRIFDRDRWDVFALRAQLGIVSADLHDRFVQGNSNGSITGADAVVSGFFATRGVFGHQAVTAAMRARAAEALDRMGVAHLARVPLDRMSTGEARRVLIARALVHRPRALVLDEPTRGLDLVSRHRFMERLRVIAREGTTMLLVTHYIDEIIPEIARVVLLDRGRIAADGPKHELLTSDRLGPLFGANLAVDRHDGYYYVRVNMGDV